LVKHIESSSHITAAVSLFLTAIFQVDLG